MPRNDLAIHGSMTRARISPEELGIKIILLWKQGIVHKIQFSIEF
jgi:hypothetical protein